MLPSSHSIDFLDGRGSLPVLVVVKDSPNIILNLTYQSLTRSSRDSDVPLSPKSLLRETNTFESHMTIKYIQKSLIPDQAPKYLNLEAGLSLVGIFKSVKTQKHVSAFCHCWQLLNMAWPPGFILIVYLAKMDLTPNVQLLAIVHHRCSHLT